MDIVILIAIKETQQALSSVYTRFKRKFLSIKEQ